MIEGISIADVATFGSPPAEMKDLREINFIFGANGAGKTTISRLIANESKFASCKIAWKGGAKLETLVYNSDFVERNFSQSVELKGVFTLGEQQVETLAKIAKAKEELDALDQDIEKLSMTLGGPDGSGGKKADLAKLEESFKEKCWEQKLKHDAKLQSAFEGVRNNMQRFKDRVLQEHGSNVAGLISIDELQKRAESIFGPAPTPEKSIPSLDFTRLLAHESNPILKKRVIGKEDVDIASMIRKLGNSDWVRAGRSYYDVSSQVCPFCQQATTEALAESLDEYFDESFTVDSRAIAELEANYTTDAQRIQQQLASIIASPSRFLELGKLKVESELFGSKLSINGHRLGHKKKEASQIVELESLQSVVAAIQSLVDSANAKVADHNKIVSNLANERKILTAQVWRLVLEELESDISAYKNAFEGLSKAIASLGVQIKSLTESRRKKVTELRDLEKQTTSIQPTIDAINKVLTSFGFEGFKLAKAESGTSYRIVRANGSDAKSTLSEGEKTFVTFLYFYHLLRGSVAESGMTSNRIVVLDDPISSLDSQVLFIVSTLIKNLCEDVRSKASSIRQVFVLTHNVYFHKEVAFHSKRPKETALKDETFWVIRKPKTESTIERHQSNPVKTSYELLWLELRKVDSSNVGLQNTLRRILENYFRVLGGLDADTILARFEGQEKMVCRSLLSWIHDGSHFSGDDLYVASDEFVMSAYLEVFKAIFVKTNHEAHYRMMMGESLVAPPSKDQAA
jgi:wobble nucleotide-excising tRNase